MGTQIHEAQRAQVWSTQVRLSDTYYSQIIKSQRQTQKFENSKRKMTHHMQGNPHKAISRFLSRNLADRGGGY